MNMTRFERATMASLVTMGITVLVGVVDIMTGLHVARFMLDRFGFDGAVLWTTAFATVPGFVIGFQWLPDPGDPRIDRHPELLD